MIVPGITFLARHVQARTKLIDGVIARETNRNDSDYSSVAVLDDVTPQYLKASHAVNSCSASLDAALKSLLEGEGT